MARRLVIVGLGAIIGLGISWILAKTALPAHPIKMDPRPGMRRVEIPRTYWHLELIPDGTSLACLAFPGSSSLTLTNPIQLTPDASDEQLAEALHTAIELVYDVSIPAETIRAKHIDGSMEEIAQVYNLGDRFFHQAAKRINLAILFASLNLLSCFPVRKLLWMNIGFGTLYLLPFLAPLVWPGTGFWLGNASSFFELSAPIIEKALYTVLPSNPLASVLCIGVILTVTYQLAARLVELADFGTPKLASKP